MSAQILDMKIESCPAARFIGKRYSSQINWGEWWANDWFSVLEKLPLLPINDDGYIGAMRTLDGVFEYWIGMFFPQDTPVPDGFEHVDIEPTDYAVFYLYGSETSGELFGQTPYLACLSEIEARGLKSIRDGWHFERYNCPRYTTPDERGNVILDHAISILR